MFSAKVVSLAKAVQGVATLHIAEEMGGEGIFNVFRSKISEFFRVFLMIIFLFDDFDILLTIERT